MRRLLPSLFVLMILWGCTSTEEGNVQVMVKDTFSSSNISDTTSYAGYATEDVPIKIAPQPEKSRFPRGIYQATIPAPVKRQQTIEFFANNNFQMQEKYAADSVVTTTGTWAPSNGFIWLYKDNLAWGRYKWKDDTLQYYNPEIKGNISMQPLLSIMNDPIWKQKGSQDVALFGIGNEPFWSIEQKAGDSLVFLLAGKGEPTKLMLTQTFTEGDSTVYVAQSDSAALRLVVLPYFCTDGMSEAIYPNKIRVQFNGQTYSGCGVKYK